MAFISIKSLALELGMDRSHFRRYVLNLGIQPVKRRTPDSNNQLTLTVSMAEADLIRRTREIEGYLPSGQACPKGTLTFTEVGYFYAVRVIPELDPTRVKLGFTENVGNRLASHRTAAPTAELIKAWPCKRSWERAIIDVVAAVGGQRISNEVYQFADVDAAIKQADALFELFPNPGTKAPRNK